MIKNPERCWQYAIQTKHLREPSESFEVLQILIQNPFKSYVDISNETGISLDKIYQWSIRYLYKERIRAYQEDMTRALFHAGINHNKKVIEAENKRVEKDNALFNNDFITLNLKEMEIMEYHKKKKTPPESLIREYNQMRKEFYSDVAIHVKKSKDLQDIATRPLQLTPEEVEQLNTNVQDFLDAIGSKRNETKNK